LSEENPMKLLRISLLSLVLFVWACTEENPNQADAGVTPADGKVDAPGKLDGKVVKPDGKVVKPDGPVVKPDGPVVKPDGPVVKPDLPVAKPDLPVAKPDLPVAKPDLPVAKPDLPVAKPDLPVAKPDLPVAKPDINTLGNSVCAGATQLGWGGKKSITVAGTTATAKNEYGSSINCGNYSTVMVGAQRYYKVSLTGGKGYRFTFAPKYHYARMYLFQTCGITGINAGCGSSGKTGAITGAISSGQSGYLVFKPTTSGTWYVAVDASHQNYKGAYSLTIDEFTVPTNETCTKAQKLNFVEGVASITGNTAGAQNEFGSKINCGYKNYNFPAPQLYYKFTAKKGYKYSVAVKPSFYAAVYAFRSNGCSASGINTDCASNGNFGFNHHYVSSYGRTFWLTPGASADYTVAIDSRYATYAGTFSIKVTEVFPQNNATCAKAATLSLTGGKVTVISDTAGLANEYGQSILCGQTQSSYAFDGPQQYYKLSMAKGKSYKISLTPAFSYARFYVFGNACGATAINKDCASGGKTGLWTSASYANQASHILFSPTASGVYHVVVDSRGSPYRGMYKLKIQEIQAPSNGTCLKPQAVSLVAGGTTVVLGDNSQLANEFGTQIFCNNYSTIYKGNQAYFKFTLTAGKKYTFTLKPKYKNARFYIFRGSCKPHDINQDCGSGGKTGLVSANSYSGNTITSAFTPTTSGTYHLAVDSTYTGTAGFFTLEVK